MDPLELEVPAIGRELRRGFRACMAPAVKIIM